MNQGCSACGWGRQDCFFANCMHPDGPTADATARRAPFVRPNRERDRVLRLALRMGAMHVADRGTYSITDEEVAAYVERLTR